jgi:sec-independent protein translocase protein TatC
MVFDHLWTFVASGLYPHEKKYVYLFMPFSLGLFFAGAALAFFVVFHFVLTFLFGFNEKMGIDPDPRISEWLSFVIFMPLGFGVSFQMPLVMLLLERIGIFTVQSYLSKWRIAVLVMAVLAMVLSPGGDPWSMLLMFLPMVVLYFLGIWLCKAMRRRNPFEEAVT